MAVERSVIFRIVLYVCAACVIVSFLFYTSMPLQTAPDSYGTEMPIPSLVPDSKEVASSGLYTKSKLIDELNAHTYKFVKEGKAPSLILYYASWCGHCRFVVDALLLTADQRSTNTYHFKTTTDNLYQCMSRWRTRR